MARSMGAGPWARAAAAAVVLALAGTTSAAAAGVSATLAWSTYLRDGPGETRLALDELEHGAAVVVRGCDGAWCRVTADGLAGFVDRDALVLPKPPAPRNDRRDCVTAGQAGSRRPEPTRFCSADAPAR